MAGFVGLLQLFQKFLGQEERRALIDGNQR